MKELFLTLKEAIAKLIDPTSIRWIGFSHFEADERRRSASGVAEDCSGCDRNMQPCLEVGERRRCSSGAAGQGFGGRRSQTPPAKPVA